MSTRVLIYWQSLTAAILPLDWQMVGLADPIGRYNAYCAVLVILGVALGTIVLIQRTKK